VTFDWIGKEKPAQRPWRGLPRNRALNSGDLRWFPTFGEGRWRDKPKPLTIAEQMRASFEACTR
jgi:hypothetical protein